MSNRALFITALLALLMSLSGAGDLHAQSYTVDSFKVLPNDVSAFINPVRDLNDEDCGLIKVIATDDFAFSTPLGIVKRVDNVGEIWLYVPRGTKKLTIKHADWGVMRDYMLPERVDSHMTYELRLNHPQRQAAAQPVETIITTVRDTLVLTRVDTVMVKPVVPPLPLTLNLIATMSVGGRSTTVMPGIMYMALKRHGGYIHAATDFGKIGPTLGECDKNGVINGATPFYTGHTRRASYMIDAGAAHRLSRRVTIYEGIGYGSTRLGWELAQSEGGGWVTNRAYCCRGVTARVGTVLSFGKLRVTASVSTIKGREWYGTVGLGINLGKK